MSVTGAQMALTVAGMRVNVAGHTMWSIFLASNAEAGRPSGGRTPDRREHVRVGLAAASQPQTSGLSAP